MNLTLSGSLFPSRRDEMIELIHECSLLDSFLWHLSTYTGPMGGLSNQELSQYCEKLALRTEQLAKLYNPDSNHSETFEPHSIEAGGQVSIPVHWLNRVELILDSLSNKALLK